MPRQLVLTWGRADLATTLLWPGFLANTALFSAILFALPTATTDLRRRTRLRRGVCPTCAYPIATSPTCTECGTPIPSPPTP